MLTYYTKLQLLFILSFPMLLFSQNYKMDKGHFVEKINFELINNLIVVPIEVNGTKLSFILDSGVGTPILFNLADQDTIQLKNVSEITINGLGKGAPIRALSSAGNFFSLGNIRNSAQELYVLMSGDVNFSPNLGIPIHGIIGYDLFKDFVLDINYVAKSIRFYHPEHYTYKRTNKSCTLPIDIINKKVYLNAEVGIRDNERFDVKLLLDTGSSDAVWLFEDKNLSVPKEHYEEFLGKGLAGDIYGKRTKIKYLKIGDYQVNNAKAAFPDMVTFSAIKNLGDRNGSLGTEVLKRFNIIFDYGNKKITIKKNSNFRKPFQYNFSGIDLQHAGVRYVSERIASSNGVVFTNEREYGDVEVLLENATKLSVVPEIIVSAIRAGSPAHSAGLQEGDIILAVNGKRIHRYKLQEILHMLNDRNGKRVKVLVERSDDDLLFSFVLKELFK